MATQGPQQSAGALLPVQASVSEPGDAEMEEDLEQLELEVKNMAEKILHYRSTLPEKLKNAFALVASAHRPEFPQIDSGSEPSASVAPHRGLCRDSDLVANSSVSKRDIDTAKKIGLLKEKTMKNIAALPIILNRMKECISTIDNLDSHPSSIHPAFRKGRTS
ncbi:hypothetical protein SAY87_012790 [Trapa incisa]|uniref:Uncharacterized protein n=1 Tax=Trapa incisa TaxID=236973 RepID=A0AAN7GTI7_9MYRT|nr:hypothetical protein SAY87_012790 [Trapa incisa]